MKKINLISVFFLGIILFLGCQKWSEPKFIAENWIPPDGTGTKQFWTIDSKNVLGNIFTPSGGFKDLPVLMANPKDEYLRYIRAVVVSSDEGGNYYKSMVIQDQTGGVELELDLPGLYNFYPVGQKIVLVCNPSKGKDSLVPGLVIGHYNNLPQIGLIYNGNQVGRINSIYFDKYIIRDGVPSPNNVPKPLKNDEIDFSGYKDVNKLVCLENVIFEKKAIGKPIAFNDFTTDWKIYVSLQNGSIDSVTVRTSNYAKFRNMIIENKKYNLTGILTTYRKTKQLMIRTKDDIEIVQSNVVLSYDFSTNPLLADDKWSNESLLGTTQWRYKDTSIFHYGNQNYESYKTAMDDWFISPVIHCPNAEKLYLVFEHKLPVLNAQYAPYQVYYTTSTSTTFNKEDWKPLGELTSFPENYQWSHKFPLSKIGSNTFRIAFRYNAPDKDIASYGWNIRKVEIRK